MTENKGKAQSLKWLEINQDTPKYQKLLLAENYKRNLWTYRIGYRDRENNFVASDNLVKINPTHYIHIYSPNDTVLTLSGMIDIKQFLHNEAS